MSEAVGGCHAGNEEKIGRLDERNNFCKVFCSAAVGVALIAGVGVWYLNGKINQVKFESAVEIEKVKTSSEIKISNLEKQVEELKKDHSGMKEYAEDGRRAYEAAKKFRQRHKD